LTRSNGPVRTGCDRSPPPDRTSTAPVIGHSPSDAVSGRLRDRPPIRWPTIGPWSSQTDRATHAGVEGRRGCRGRSRQVPTALQVRQTSGDDLSSAERPLDGGLRSREADRRSLLRRSPARRRRQASRLTRVLPRGPCSKAESGRDRPGFPMAGRWPRGSPRHCGE
jgi:hypothetical protein